MRRLAIMTIAACASAPRPFPLREPFVHDTDTRDVSVACRPDPDPKQPDRKTCAPREYISPFIWDHLDNTLFAPLSRTLSVERHGEAANANSMDEVADSAWFTNRPRAPIDEDDNAPGACNTDDMLPAQDQVPDATWVIDHGKDNGSTPGFRIDVPGKGKYMLKADDPGKPERASAASVIGAAFLDALGYNTTCEQIVVLRKSQLKLTPKLETIDNANVHHPFDAKALDKVLAASTQLPGGLVRMQASKWLPGLTVGPFRYVGTRADDPNDVINHADRRELRGNRLLAAWLDHWDAREQNSMDVWMAANAKDKRSSPGHVVHYFLDTSDTLGGEVGERDMSARLGHSYTFDFGDVGRSLITLGIDERSWDRAHETKGFEKFGFYTARDFDPAGWKPMYPNPAYLRATERDNAWMARLIARLSPEDVRKLVLLGRWSRQADTDYVTNILLIRQRAILARYFRTLSPLGEVHGDRGQICATDFARLRGTAPSFRYSVVERSSGRAFAIPAEVMPDGDVCFQPRAVVRGTYADDDPARIVVFEVRNGTSAGPLVVHTYDLGRRGMRIVGVTRPEA